LQALLGYRNPRERALTDKSNLGDLLAMAGAGGALKG
jgi:hypothetical protein